MPKSKRSKVLIMLTEESLKGGVWSKKLIVNSFIKTIKNNAVNANIFDLIQLIIFSVILFQSFILLFFVKHVVPNS